MNLCVPCTNGCTYEPCLIFDFSRHTLVVQYFHPSYFDYVFEYLLRYIFSKELLWEVHIT